MFKVRKDCGEIEDYDTKKLMVSIIRGLATPDEALKVTTIIETWLVSKNSEIIDSSEIRAKVVEELKKLNPDAAHAYEVYRKPQEPGLK